MKTLHVLLVEDNEADADLTRDTLLESKVHVSVDVVRDGEQALDYVSRRGAHASVPRPDLILLDLNLPKLSGREVLDELKRSEDLRAIPVVVLTSSDAEIDIARTYALGASCYVTKPVGLAAFQEIVRAVNAFWFTIVKLP